MDMPILTGFVFGRLWAERRNVQSSGAQNRAGMLMAIGGRANPALGLVLANESIGASETVPPSGQVSTGQTPTGQTPTGKGQNPDTSNTGSPPTPPVNPKIAATVSFDEPTRRMVRTAAQDVGRAAKAVEAAAKAQSSSAAAALRMLGPESSSRRKARAPEGDISLE